MSLKEFARMERQMRKRKFFLLIMITVMAAVLVACGPSDEKLMEAETARNLLLEARETAESTYLDISEITQRAKLDELSERVTEVEAIDFTKMNDKKIDEVLPSIQELTDEYQSVQGGLSETLKAETEVKEEKARHTEVNVCFINKTGMNLSRIVLRDVTRGTESDNYIGDGVILGDGYTLMGPALDLYEGSTEWEFVVTGEDGTDHILESPDLRNGGSRSIVLKYDSATGTGTAEFAPDPKEAETENASENAAEGASDASSENAG